jgi:hypothetical protein
MSHDLGRRLKLALDETRLLILGVQVLLSFQFAGFFQDEFQKLPPISQTLSLVTLCLLIVSIALLILPSMQHRLVEAGASTSRLLRATTLSSGLSLVPLSISLGLAVYVVLERHFGGTAGVICGLLLTAIAGLCWFGLEMFVGISTQEKPMQASHTPLSTRVEQLLTEARLIIPGAQALFGFQFIAMLTSGFDHLPPSAKTVHAVALCLVAINVVLLMTPAALHRLSFAGEDSATFLQIGSAFLIAAPLFLAAGIAAEMFVVFLKVLESATAAAAAALLTFLFLAVLWYAFPVFLKANQNGPSHER